MKNAFFISTLYFLIVFMAIGLLNTQAQSNPADLFDDLCADCHSIGEGDMKGPDLIGVERLHDEAWLIKFIKSSKTMIGSGDLKAVSIWKKFEKNKMPDTSLTDEEIISLIGYIKSFNKTKETVIVSNQPIKSKSTNLNATSQNLDILTSKIDKTQAELQKLEKKIDLILEFNKKSFSARITDSEIKIGKELFEGVRPFKNKVKVCVSCHNTSKIDTLNWNPSAYDIAKLLSDQSTLDMSNIIVNPSSDKMKEVLKDHKLTNDESFYITAFFQNIEKKGLKDHKKIPVKLIVFIIACLIMVTSILDLMFTKKIKKRWINITVFFFTAIFVGNTIVVNARNVGLSENYSPFQPIKFSHRIHVKENKIQCVFCHNSPEFSRESGIPTTNVCMICHNKIKTGTMTGQFEINKIKSSFKNKKPIEWIKVHNLPDHVFFSHAQHVSVGKIDCKTCHGAIDEMDVTYQKSSLSMGWCIKCHRETDVQFSENKFYSNHTELQDDLKSGKISKITVDKIGANDCQKCHY